MGNTIDNGMKTFSGGKHALAGVFDHEFATRVFGPGAATWRQLQSAVSPVRHQPQDWLQMAPTTPRERRYRLGRSLAETTSLAATKRASHRATSTGDSRSIWLGRSQDQIVSRASWARPLGQEHGACDLAAS